MFKVGDIVVFKEIPSVKMIIESIIQTVPQMVSVKFLDSDKVYQNRRDILSRTYRSSDLAYDELCLRKKKLEKIIYKNKRNGKHI